MFLNTKVTAADYRNIKQVIMEHLTKTVDVSTLLNFYNTVSNSKIVLSESVSSIDIIIEFFDKYTSKCEYSELVAIYTIISATFECGYILKDLNGNQIFLNLPTLPPPAPVIEEVLPVEEVINEAGDHLVDLVGSIVNSEYGRGCPVKTGPDIPPKSLKGRRKK